MYYYILGGIMGEKYVYIFVKKFGLNGKQELEKFILDTGESYQNFAKNKIDML